MDNHVPQRERVIWRLRLVLLGYTVQLRSNHIEEISSEQMVAFTNVYKVLTRECFIGQPVGK